METITVGMADCRVSANPDSQLVTHALGSCIGVAIHDPCAKVAGLLHFMLPDSKMDAERGKQKPYMFADTGIPSLFHAAYAQGADKRRIVVRVLGGAQVMDPSGVFNIGKRNHLACRKILWAAGVLIQQEEIGGTIPRTVRLEVASGRLSWTTGSGPATEMTAGKEKS